MATYNTVMKKRNANNDGWDIVLPVSIAENILVGQSQIPLSEYLETKIDKSMIVQNALSTNPDTVASGPALKNVQDQVNTLSNNLADMVTQGAWTPVINVDISYGAQFGRYVKIGKQLTLYFYIYGNVNSADTGMAEISGLPFPAVSMGNARFSGVVGNHNIGSMAGTLTLLLQDKWQFIRVVKNGKEMLNKSDFAIGNQFIMGQVTYLID